MRLQKLLKKKSSVCIMDLFFRGIINDKILSEYSKILQNIEKCRLRDLKSNLRRNEPLRKSLNSGHILLKDILSMSIYEMADENLRNIRITENENNLRQIIVRYDKPSKDEIDIITNKVEDP
jgi:hypothetical protein